MTPQYLILTLFVATAVFGSSSVADKPLETVTAPVKGDHNDAAPVKNGTSSNPLDQAKSSELDPPPNTTTTTPPSTTSPTPSPSAPNTTTTTPAPTTTSPATTTTTLKPIDNCEDHQQMETYFQTLPAKETEISALQDENSLENGLEAQRNTEEQRISQLNLKIEELHHTISGAVEKNLQQHIALLALSEEKREAIRQLCFAMDTLRDKNQRLKEALKYSRGCRHTSLCPALGRDPNLAL